MFTNQMKTIETSLLVEYSKIYRIEACFELSNTFKYFMNWDITSNIWPEMEFQALCCCCAPTEHKLYFTSETTNINEWLVRRVLKWKQCSLEIETTQSLPVDIAIDVIEWYCRSSSRFSFAAPWIWNWSSVWNWSSWMTWKHDRRRSPRT